MTKLDSCLGTRFHEIYYPGHNLAVRHPKGFLNLWNQITKLWFQSYLMLPHPARYLQDNRVACEMGLYYVLHIAKLRNKNALQRLLPALGEYKLLNIYKYIFSICACKIQLVLLLNVTCNKRVGYLFLPHSGNLQWHGLWWHLPAPVDWTPHLAHWWVWIRRLLFSCLWWLPSYFFIKVGKSYLRACIQCRTSKVPYPWSVL